MTRDQRDAAALAFLGDKLNLDDFEEQRWRLDLRLTTPKGDIAHLNGEPGAVLDELIRLARLGVMVGLMAAAHPDQRAGAVFQAAERKVARRKRT